LKGAKDWSVPPPAASGITTSICRVGKSAAVAVKEGPVKMRLNNAAPINPVLTVLFIFSSLSFVIVHVPFAR
jgi:hypothetical protein